MSFFSWGALKQQQNELGTQIDKYGSQGSNPLAEEGLNGMRDLDTTYQQNIDAGGLSPGVKRGFDVGRGALADQYARAGRSLSSALAARRQQSGGALSAGAIADLTKEGQSAADEQYFGASNDLTNSEANLAYTSTKDFYSKINANLQSIATAGLTREQQQLMAKLQLASMRLGAKTDVTKALLGMVSL
jgi:hypothetical protein